MGRAEESGIILMTFVNISIDGFCPRYRLEISEKNGEYELSKEEIDRIELISKEYFEINDFLKRVLKN